MKTKVLPQSEVVGLLYKTLGAQRAWADFLADCIRGKTTFYGLELLPCCYIRDKRVKRPQYHIEDVRAFIKKAASCSAPTRKVQFNLVDLDSADRTYWKYRVLPSITKTPGSCYSPNVHRALPGAIVCRDYTSTNAFLN